MVDSPYREITRPIIDFVKSVRRGSPRDVVTVFVPEYVVGRWWENLLHNQSALRIKGRLLFEPGVMVTSVPWQLRSSQDRDLERLDRDLSPRRAARRPRRTGPAPSQPGTDEESGGQMTDLDYVEGDTVEVTVGAPAHGGHCVARIGGEHGRVVFVRHALPGERVTAEITELHKGYLRADAIEIHEAAPDRVTPPCPYAHAQWLWRL